VTAPDAGRAVVGLYRSVLPTGMAGRHLETRSPGALYRKALSAKANPRPLEYMRARFDERFAGGAVIDVDAEPAWRERAAAADTVVLLYPDAIGLGFGTVERSLPAASGPPIVLNGRRREFPLDRGTRRSLRVRRVLEWTMAPELVATVAFLVVTPVLLVLDWIRGRR
jgi:hypothetical protein